MKQPPDREHEFTLVLAGTDELTDTQVDALYEAGCNDATIVERSGRAFLCFTRAGVTLRGAVLSAIRDVAKANISAEVLRLDIEDLVTQADIARKLGKSRQLIYQYFMGVRGPGGFPPPASESGESAAWLWQEVADWLVRNDMVPQSVLDDARDAAAINAWLAWRRVSHTAPPLPDDSMTPEEHSRRTEKVSWQDLLAILQQHVPAGRVTTYGRCSESAFGHPGASPSIVAMLNAAARRGHHVWTNRVVSDDGSLGAAVEAYGQLTQLQAEGVPMSGARRVNLGSCPPVELPAASSV